MSLVDWSKIDKGWKWVTTDLDGVTVWDTEPELYCGPPYPYYVSDGECLPISNLGGEPIKEPRPTNTVGDPLSALWLYNLEVKKGNKFNGYDRSDLIQLIHALVKELS